MALLAVLFSYVVVLAVLPSASAGPACARKYWQKQSCIEQCKGKWGYPGMMMGTGPWGAVIQQTEEDSWDSVIAQACGTSVSSTSGGSATVAAGALETFSTSASSSSVILTASSVPQVTPVSSSQISSLSSFVQNITSDSIQSSSSIAPVTSSTFVPFTSSSPPPAPPTTTQATPSSSSSSSSEFTPDITATSTEQPSPTTTSTPPPATTSSSASSSPSSSSNSFSSSGTTSDSDIQAYLSAHNSVRAQHGASPLTWSDDAASKAQQWANNCKFVHSGGSLGPFGENLAAGTGDSYGIPQAIKSWTDEVSQYDPSNPQASHFTQVVWKGTSQVGCAVQSCSGIFDASFGLAKFYVCEYSAQGNIIGQFAENVQV